MNKNSKNSFGNNSPMIVWALFVARSKEFYRDRGALIWSLIFPACVIAAIAFAFSGEDQKLFRVGVYQAEDQEITHSLVNEPYVIAITYTSLEKALIRLRHHQVDLLLSAEQPGFYWVNEKSSKGRVLEQLLTANNTREYSRQTVSGRQVRYVDWVIPGVLSMNVMFGALFGIGFVIVRYRKNGVLKRLQATPVTALQFLTAQVLSRLLLLISAVSIVYIGCNFFLNFIMLGSYINLFIVAALGIFSMISLALIVASRTSSEELANGLLNFVSFPMLLLSEVWFALDDAPQWLVTISNLFPLTHMVQAAREIMINGENLATIGHHLWILVAMSVVFMAIAAYLFRWNEK